MMTIWKFPVQPSEHYVVEMPRGARLLSVQTQGGEPALWALCNPQSPRVKRSFSVFGTGHDATAVELLGMKYVGTFQIGGGTLVFHLFDQGEKGVAS